MTGTLRSLSVRVPVILTFAIGIQLPLSAQRQSTPIRQSTLTFESATQRPLTMRDASRNSRWLGLGVRDIRWAPDGSVVYFRWNENPGSNDLAAADPWFRAERDGRWVEQVPAVEVEFIPAANLDWSGDGKRATWARSGSVYLYDGDTRLTRRVIGLAQGAQRVRFSFDDGAIEFEAREALYRYTLADGSLVVVAAKVSRDRESQTDAAEWLAAQQRDLFQHVRNQDDLRDQSEVMNRSALPHRPQAIPVASASSVDNIQLSPDGAYLTFRVRNRDRQRPPTQYVDYVDESGYSQVHDARPKVGEPRDVVRMGVVTVDPTLPAESIAVRWVEIEEAGDQNSIPHGPYWSPDGTHAVAQFIGEDHQDLWYAEVDMAAGGATVLTHDHDDAWIGGPPIQANYLQPALLEWLPDGRFVFASERSGWSHLYIRNRDGSIAPLTEGEWEVRGATLSHDLSTWLLQASREHPSDDHLYLMDAAGGEMRRLTEEPGRSTGYLSPDGSRVALIYSETVQLPDLFLQRARPGSDQTRITQSGSDAFYTHPLVQPEIVEFTHPDGGPLWAAIFRPEQPNAERAAIVHVHGGGYRQFAHRGYSVYGYQQHLGPINYMVQQGYTVLDFDYRGSAGFGRDYRTDIARSMGIKDADGAAAAASYLVHEQGIDSTRIGIFGISYGGFMTLMAQFRYPGVFAAGIARASVTDWAHYSDGWTSRILGVPHEDPEAYEISSPIYYAEGLQDALLITHGLVDNNVHFQDVARLVQRLIELEKAFEVMYYPVEPHSIQTEPSRYDYVKRAMKFFDQHLRGIVPQ